jgi:hypothetical protein
MPSLYESTVNTGEVSSSNFTTLYNASGLSVPNAGAGSVTGNLNVGGNLTVQGSSLLIGEVTLQSTLSLPNYTFPLPDGTTDQVLVTDGNGNLYWTDVSAIPGADYSIEATTATGGANLTLSNTAGFTDSVKFAAGTNMSIVRTDANTITISTVADNIPDGTAQGQVLYWNGSAWTASSNITSSASANRLVLTYQNTGAGANSALFLRKDYGATNYSETNNDGVGLSYGVTSTAQGLNTYGVVNFEYSATDPQFVIGSSTDNFATNTATLVLDKASASLYAPNITLNKNQTGTPTLDATITANRGSSTDATLTWNETTDTWDFTNSVVIAGDLAVNGGDITTVPGGIANLYNNNAVDTINIGNSVVTEVNIGNTSGSRVQIKSPTIVGANATQAVFNTVATTVNAFGAATNITMGVDGAVAGAGTTTIRSANTVVKGDLAVNGDNTGSSADITTTKTTASLFNTNATTLNIGGASTATNIGAATGTTTLGNNLDVNGEQVRINANNTAADSYLYMKGSNEYLKWNNTDAQFELSDTLFITKDAYPAIFERQKTTADFPYEAKTALKLIERVTDAPNNATDDGGANIIFARTSGASGGAEVLYGSFQFDYYGTTNTAEAKILWTDDNFAEPTPGNFPGTYVLQKWNDTDSEFFNNSLFVDYTTLGSAKVGVNMTTPAYTLDVNGDANVSGDIYVSGVHVNLSTPVHQGQLLYVSDDVTPTITNSSLITFGSLTYRPTFEAKTGIYGRTQSGTGVISNTGATPFTTGDGSSINWAVDSDSQSLTTIGSISTAYDTTGDHEIRLSTSTNNFASDQATSITGGNTLVFSSAHGYSIGDKLIYSSPTQNGLTYNTTYYVISTGFTTTQCQVSSTLGGSAVALTNGTGLSLWFFNGVKRLISATAAELDIQAPTILLNATNTGIPFTGTAGLEVERGTSGANQTFAWDETNDFWRSSSSLYVDDYAIGGLGLATNGNNIYYNNENTSPAGTSNLIVKSGVSAGVDANFRWNDTTKRWQDTTNGTTYFDLPNQNLDTTSDVSFSGITLDSRSTFNTGATTTTSTSTFTLDETNRNAIKLMVYIEQGTNSHALEILIMRTSASAMMTTYGEMYTTSPLATFTADQSAGNIRVRCTPTSATSTTFSVVRYSLT